MKNRLKHIIFSILALIFTFTELCAQGIMFQGQNTTIEQRSSLSIKPPLLCTPSNRLEISFKFRIFPDYRSGYVMSLETGKGDDPVIDLFYDGVSDKHCFSVIWEGRRYISEIVLPKENDGYEWLDVKISMDSQNDYLTLSIGKPYSVSRGGSIELPEKIYPYITFGKSKRLIDVPCFGMRDLHITLGGIDWNYKFMENSGNYAFDSNSLSFAKGSNIVWLSNNSCHWKKRAVFSSSSFLCAGHDSNRHLVYAFNRDSISYYHIEENYSECKAFWNRCPVEISLGTNFMDPSDDGIFAYEVYYDDKHTGRPSTFARLDPEELIWEDLGNEQWEQQLHHHCEYIDTETKSIIIFGGFGNRRFSNKFLKLGDGNNFWEEIPITAGDKIEPRYFASMGHDEESGLLYVFGGLGNEIGDQIVGKQYLYNLYEVDIVKGESRLLWATDIEGPNCVVARNMIIPGDGWFYVLCYPENLTQSSMSLMRFNLKDGSHEMLGDKIPIYSDKITTNANLHFDEEKQRLVAIVEESPDDITSKVSIYTIDFPPALPGYSTVAVRRISLLTTLILISVIVSGISTAVIVRRRRERLQRRSIRAIDSEVYESRPNTILLFGGFKAIDRKGEDISPLFTGKILQLFCLLLRAERKGGASSKRITGKLWPDREPEKAKNIRGVTISKLRKILEKIDGISLEYEEGRFNLKFSDECYCDYMRFYGIIRSEERDMDTLVSIITRGRVLSGENAEIFDRLKAEVEEITSKSLTEEMIKRYDSKQYTYAINCADLIMEQYNLDEKAIKYVVRSYMALKNEDEARMRYVDFCKRYKKDYDENFPRTFEELVRQD